MTKTGQTKVCIFGAGAVGGYIAGTLAQNEKADVSVVARGEHLSAIQKNGLRLRFNNGDIRTSHPNASDDANDLGPQDFVIVAVKANAIPHICENLLPLLHEETSLVFAVNGVPWWYFYRHGGALENNTIEAVDPGGQVWTTLGPERAIGCVVYVASEIEAPGVIRFVSSDRLTLGEPSGERSNRVATLSRLLVEAGIKAPVRKRIREEMWIKLWGNSAFNPISILTHATLEDMCNDNAVCAFARTVMCEVEAVANALGITFPITIEQRIAAAREVGTHKTSTLQDLERGRPMELDALATAVQELARMLSVPTPNLDSLMALANQRARVAGLG